MISFLEITPNEDSCLAQRKVRYRDEGRTVFSGPIYVPDDLDVLVLD